MTVLSNRERTEAGMDGQEMTMNATNGKMSFVRHTWTLDILARLRLLKVGEFLSYDQLCADLGVQSFAAIRAYLYSAQRSLFSETGIAVVVTPETRGRGLVRLNEAAKAEWVGRSLTSIQRQAKRGIRRARSVDASELTNEERVKLHATMSLLGALAVVSDPKAQERIHEGVVSSRAQLPVGKTLEAFKK